MTGKAEQKSFTTPDETRARAMTPGWWGEEPVRIVDWHGASSYARG
jgi:hypothetical protein